MEETFTDDGTQTPHSHLLIDQRQPLCRGRVLLTTGKILVYDLCIIPESDRNGNDFAEARQGHCTFTRSVLRLVERAWAVPLNEFVRVPLMGRTIQDSRSNASDRVPFTACIQLPRRPEMFLESAY